MDREGLIDRDAITGLTIEVHVHVHVHVFSAETYSLISGFIVVGFLTEQRLYGEEYTEQGLGSTPRGTTPSTTGGHNTNHFSTNLHVHSMHTY
jgi:hypothetical protein